MSKVKRRTSRGQTVIETVFVFSMLLFMGFGIVNLSIKYHTHNVATYAAFMAARSYQVIGSGDTSRLVEEVTPEGGTDQFLYDLEGLGQNNRILTVQKVAEDIFTCALPWIEVPESDRQGVGSLGDDQSELATSDKTHCLEGQRRYEAMNIADERKLTFGVFGDQNAFGGVQLGAVPGSFAEENREGLRYGILTLRYRTPIVVDPLGVFTKGGEEPYAFGQVSTPVLLNPGLDAGISTEPVDPEDDIREVFEEN